MVDSTTQWDSDLEPIRLPQDPEARQLRCRVVSGNARGKAGGTARGKAGGTVRGATQHQTVLVEQFEGDDDDLLTETRQLVERTGCSVRAEDLTTGVPVMMIEILPTHPQHYHVACWDGEAWTHRMLRRMPMA